jgi:hypothetical protein
MARCVLAGWLTGWAGLGWRKKVRMQPGAAAEVAQRSAAMLKQACEDCDVLWCAVVSNCMGAQTYRWTGNRQLGSMVWYGTEPNQSHPVSFTHTRT